MNVLRRAAGCSSPAMPSCRRSDRAKQAARFISNIRRGAALVQAAVASCIWCHRRSRPHPVERRRQCAAGNAAAAGAAGAAAGRSGATADNTALNQRVQQLEGQLAEERRLLQVSNHQLQQMQSRGAQAAPAWHPAGPRHRRLDGAHSRAEQRCRRHRHRHRRPPLRRHRNPCSAGDHPARRDGADIACS